MLDGLAELNQRRLAVKGDPEIASRIEQYEMAFRMQTSVPELVDLPAGCPFAGRCRYAIEVCQHTPPPAIALGDSSRGRTKRSWKSPSAYAGSSKHPPKPSGE